MLKEIGQRRKGITKNSDGCSCGLRNCRLSVLMLSKREIYEGEEREYIPFYFLSEMSKQSIGKNLNRKRLFN